MRRLGGVGLHVGVHRAAFDHRRAPRAGARQLDRARAADWPRAAGRAARHTQGDRRGDRQRQAGEAAQRGAAGHHSRKPAQEMVGSMGASSSGNGMPGRDVLCHVAGHCHQLRARPAKRWSPAWRNQRGLNGDHRVCHAPGPGWRRLPVFAVTSRLGLAVLARCWEFIGTILVGFLIHMLVVYSLVVWWFGGMSPWQFFGDISDAMLTYLGTSSSNATLPTAATWPRRISACRAKSPTSC